MNHQHGVNMWPQLLQLINPFGIVQGILKDREHKRELKDAKHERQAQNVREGRIAEVNWNMKAHEGRSWITGWFVILLSIPLIGAFIPSAVPHIHKGFEALEAMPLWYQAGVGSALALAFAAKQLQDIAFKTKMNKAYTLPSGA